MHHNMDVNVHTVTILYSSFGYKRGEDNKQNINLTFIVGPCGTELFSVLVF